MELIGRDEELAEILSFLDARRESSRALVIEGEAGIGKTALWLAAVEEAQARGFLVLSCRPSEAAAGFSFSGLADLVGGVVDEVLSELPSPQRRALEAALALSDPDGPPEEGVLAFALLGALRRLAAAQPLALAVDDVQWLDAPSLVLLSYALERLDREPVATLLTVRGDAPCLLRRESLSEQLLELELGPLSLGALHELLRSRLDAAFPRPVLLRIRETSGGNPFFALELARALERRGRPVEPGDALPVPDTLEALIHERLELLTREAEEACRVAAALAEPTTRLIDSAAGSDTGGLEDAVHARVLELDGDRVRFSHPLLGSAITARMPDDAGRALHARLAGLVSDPEERARHLALAAAGPDASVAEALDAAVRRASARGAVAVAAELAEQARRLTPPDDFEAVRKRVVEAARLVCDAGDPERAAALLEEALGDAPAGPRRATILRWLAVVRARTAGPRDAVELYRAALAEVGDDARLEAEIHFELANILRFVTGLIASEPHAAAAVTAAERSGDPETLCVALSLFGLIHFKLGRGIDEDVMARAVALEEELALPLRLGGAKFSLCDQRFWSHDLDAARPLAEELYESERHREGGYGTEGPWYLALIEWRSGGWERAAELADEVRAVDQQLGAEGLSPVDEWPRTLIAAHRGYVEEARELAREGLARAEAAGIGTAQAGHRWVLGFLDLSLGDPDAALLELRVAHGIRESVGHREPGQMWELPDLLDALVAVGELDEAEAFAGEWERRARTLDRAWALAIAARTRALVLASRGDLDGSFATFERALAEHARTKDPFQRARTVLAFGATQRRAKRRRAARETLEQALEAFDRLPAPLWADKARAELARIGGRAPSRGELTEAEQRIAALVAQGRTNREVAAALFLTEHTVETALSRVYRKLGVRSRTELATLTAREAAERSSSKS